MEDPGQGETLLTPDKAMQFMYSREAFHHHQTRIGNIKQTQRADFYMPAPTEVHPQALVTWSRVPDTALHQRQLYRAFICKNVISVGRVKVFPS